jgi:glucosamine--fructose-6-phosphate aminotransferase (isomerizing)
LGSPLVLGIGDGEYFLASDPAALVGLTDRVVYLEDRQVATISADGWEIFDGQRE